MEKNNDYIINQIIQEKKLALSIPEAAKLLSISDTAMRQLARTAGFPSFKVGTRLLISAKGLESWVDEQAKKGIML